MGCTYYFNTAIERNDIHGEYFSVHVVMIISEEEIKLFM